MKLDLLEEIGLTRSEINVYVALLELGSTTTGPLVEHSKASSSKIYEILEKLIQKGLASYMVKSGTKYFEASDPKRLLDYMQEKEEKLKQQEQKLEKLLPTLELKKMLSKYKSEAKVYKGIKGMETVYTELIDEMKKGEETQVFVVGEIDEKMQQFFKQNYELRAQKGIKTKTIFSEGGRSHYEERKNIPFFEGKVIGTTSSPATVQVYHKKVILRMGDSHEVICVVINNEKLVKAFKEQFNAMWNQQVQTYEGKKAVRQAFDSVLSTATKKDEVVVFAARPGDEDIADYNLQWNARLKEKVKRSRLLYYGMDKTNQQRVKEIEELGCETKILPTEETLPISTIVLGDTILNSVWQGKPVTFKIENKVVADSFRKNFEMLWEQDTTVVKGIKPMLEALKNFVGGIDQGDTFNALGATFGPGGNKQEFADIFKKYHDHRIKKGIKARLLFQPGAQAMYEKNKKNYANCEVRFLPYDTDSPVSIHPYKDKTMMIIQEEIPTTITIHNKEITQSFEKHFESLWGQETTVAKGWDAFEKSLYDHLDEVAEEGGYKVIGAAFGKGKAVSRYEKFFKGFHKERIKRKIKGELLFPKGQEELFRRNMKNYEKYAKVKFLPYGMDLPVVFFPSKEKTRLVVQDDPPTVITIDNKRITGGFKQQFEGLWEQAAKP